MSHSRITGLQSSSIIKFTLITFILLSPRLEAGVQDDRFFQYVDDACTGAVVVPITQQLADLCSARNNNSSGANTPLFNLGIGGSSAQNRVSISTSDEQNALEERLEEIKDEQGGGAAGDSGGWGLLLSVQDGEAERDETDLESGFDSDFSGVTIGADYSFSDSFILGAAFSDSEDEGEFSSGTGDFSVESTSVVFYGLWLVNDNIGVDFYVGDGESDNSNRREVVFGSIDGEVTGDYDSEQSLMGIAVNYDYPINDWNLGAFVAIDMSETDIDAYTEDGLDPDTGTVTLLELQFPEQTVESSTTTLGLRLDYAIYFEWGVLIPGIQVAFVREEEDDKRFVNAALPFTPDYFFEIETDDPDRNYTIQTLSLVVATNDGLQGFVNLEQRSGHDFLDTTDVIAGLVYQF